MYKLLFLHIFLLLAPYYKPNPCLTDKCAGKTTNKKIEDNQFTTYLNRLKGLLEANNFSGFAVNIRRALADYPNDPQFLALKKQWVIKDYKANCPGTGSAYEQYFTRAPDESKCEPGIINKKGHDIVLQKINYCRRLAGSPDSCMFDEELNKKCQKAALMMSVNDALSHKPPRTWKCFSMEGASAAGSSNLSLGIAFDDAIIGQMKDDGTGNHACGHRRWILKPDQYCFWSWQFHEYFKPVCLWYK